MQWKNSLGSFAHDLGTFDSRITRRSNNSRNLSLKVRIRFRITRRPDKSRRITHGEAIRLAEMHRVTRGVAAAENQQGFLNNSPIESHEKRHWQQFLNNSRASYSRIVANDTVSQVIRSASYSRILARFQQRLRRQ